MTPSEELREAAEKLRALAEQATPGPWEIEYSYHGHEPQALFIMDPEYPDDPDMSIGIGIMDHTPADNVWVAVMSPAVAAPVAAMLLWTAEQLQWAEDWTNVAQWGLDARDLARLIRGES